MGTPRFETEQDLINEKEVAEELAKRKNLGLVKLPQNSLDYMLCDTDGVGVCFIEIKCFTANHDAYPTTIVSLNKWHTLKKFECILPTFFVVRWGDGVIHYINSVDIKGEVKNFSRNNQRENAYHDTEVCMYVDKELFVKL